MLRPLLWNVVYDGVLKLCLPAQTETIAYADDLVVLVSGRTEEEIQTRGNSALSLTDKRIQTHGLKLVVNKCKFIC